MNQFLVGAILMASLVIGLFFLRFWKSTGDRFFVYFALSFLIEGFNHLLLISPGHNGECFIYYGLRVLAYGLIVVAILRKNRGPKNAERSIFFFSFSVVVFSPLQTHAGLNQGKLISV